MNLLQTGKTTLYFPVPLKKLYGNLMDWPVRFALLVLTGLVPLVLAGSMLAAVRRPDGVAGALVARVAKSGGCFLPTLGYFLHNGVCPP